MNDSDTIDVRRAVAGDLPLVHAIVRRATKRLDEEGILQWDERYPSAGILEEDIASGTMRVILVNGQVAGLGVVNEEKPDEYDSIPWAHLGKAAIVHRLAIDPDRQGKGLATRLLEALEIEVAQRGYDVIRLDAFAANPASCALYERRGYTRAGTTYFHKGLFILYEKRVPSA